MSWESNGAAPSEPADWARRAWIAIAVAIALMIAAIWYARESSPRPTEAHAMHILVTFTEGDATDRARALELITGLRQRILEGEDFGALAREYSNDPPSAAKGGDLGWVNRKLLVDAVDSYLWSAPLNEVSDVIVSGFGFHLVTVLDRHISKIDQYEFELRERALRGGTAPPAAPNPAQP